MNYKLNKNTNTNEKHIQVHMVISIFTNNSNSFFYNHFVVSFQSALCDGEAKRIFYLLLSSYF